MPARGTVALWLLAVILVGISAAEAITLARRSEDDPVLARSRVRILLLVALALLVYGTVAVFLVFDRNSHSASDTLRPFLITMVPVWLIAVGGARVLLRR